ncbi:hypothetical protein [Kitasatospora sp. NPDC051705]|uniref:hypothetical protein n=1 Tax=Kitasatospora sp. NPDC051705 TaxID=3364057 RepID=UPI0037B2A7BB
MYGPPPAGPGYPPPPPGPQPGYPPPAGPLTGPPTLASWGAGRPYDPKAGQSAALRGLLGADWRPALVAAVAPTLVLLLAALVAAVPSDYQYAFLFRAPEFGERYGAALAMALNALGAPFQVGYHTTFTRGDAGGTDLLLRVVPMTVTVLWAVALWLGLRAGARRRRSAGIQLTKGQAAGEALRTAVVLSAVTALLGLLGGTSWQPERGGAGYPGGIVGRALGATYTMDSGWPEAVGWTALLAGLLAFAVHGTDALRWAAWRSRAVRGWAVAALTAGQALALTLGLASLTGFVLVAANSDKGWQTAVSLAFLPNLGLGLLGLGSGATLRFFNGVDGVSSGGGDYGDYGGSPDRTELSFFDLPAQSADWRWTGLLALAAAGILGWSAYRRQLDAADRLRLAGVYAVLLVALSAAAGALTTTTSSSATGGWGTAGRQLDTTRETSVGLVFVSVLLASLVWAAVGALLVPPLLAAVRGRGAAARYGAAPHAAGPLEGAPHEGAPHEGAPFAGASPGVPHLAAQPSAPAAEVREVIGSSDAPPAGHAPPAAAGESVDPSVWRKQD